MRYFIGYLASDEIAKYYNSITTDLSNRFGIEDLSKRVSAHITIIYPFESDTSEGTEERVRNYIHNKTSFDFRVKGFGEFKGNDGTIFLAVESNQKLKIFLKDCITELANINEYYRFGNDFHPHISIARHLNPDIAEEIWKYLHTLPTPDFQLIFDNLSIFEYLDDKWNLKRSFGLSSEV